ncbi:unnamed protein product [Bathycoccus prasinos]|mmetsp:Transcript_3895/g.12905  ORF Transcript_3895/g.12905 Transcript_3895/m.12905 type:complete len:90 (+) Transcript_3895:77-346(+)
MAVLTELGNGESAGLGLGHNSDLPPRPKLRRNAKKNVNVENVTPIAQEAKLPKKVNNQIITLAFTLALIVAVFGTIVAVALLYFVKKMR